jgi:hypothetical protein
MDSSSSSTAQLCSKEHEIGAYMIAIVAVISLREGGDGDQVFLPKLNCSTIARRVNLSIAHLLARSRLILC